MRYKHLLIIDDDSDDIEIFLSAIKGIGVSITCSTEEDSKHALHQLLSGDLAPDLIFMDLNMPVMNGLQCLIKIKEAKAVQKIPVIILSTSADPVTKAKLMASGASEFITKPDNFNDLKAILRSVL